MPDRPARILVVDDSPIVLDATRDALEAGGYEVLTHCGEGSFEAVLAEDPDLVLLDANIPHRSTRHLANLLASTGAMPPRQVLLYSSLSPPELARETKRVGADGYVEKTNDVTGLNRRVGAFLAARSKPGS